MKPFHALLGASAGTHAADQLALATLLAALVPGPGATGELTLPLNPMPQAEIDALLGPDAPLVAAAYGVTPGGNGEPGWGTPYPPPGG